MRISTYPEPYTFKVLPLITDFVVSNIALAYSTRMTKRNNIRGPAIVLGLLVPVAFTVFLLAAAPGKKFLEASGTSSNINPMSDIENMYNAENIRCAFGQVNCAIFG